MGFTSAICSPTRFFLRTRNPWHNTATRRFGGTPVGFFFMIVFLFVSVCIVGLVLLQEGKGGGLTGMSTGMDGVMGAKNPLRRMTAVLFTFFILMCLGINWYFHNRSDSGKALPAGMELPQAVGNDGTLRPETAVQAVTDAMEAAAATTEPAATAPVTPEQPAAIEPTATDPVAVEPAATVETPAENSVETPAANQ